MIANPDCPHCGKPVNMYDSDIYCQHTTYWGEDGPKPHTCGSCSTDFYLDERVSRHWVAGRTQDEARHA